MGKRTFDTKPFDPVQMELLREATRRTSPATEIAATSTVAPVPLPHPVSPPPVEGMVQRNPAPTQIAPGAGLGRPAPVAQPIRTAGIAKRFMITREEDAALHGLLARLESRARTKVTLSSLVRSALQVLSCFEDSIAEEMAAHAPGHLPSNHDAVAMSLYEEWCTRCLLEALRKNRGVGRTRGE